MGINPFLTADSRSVVVDVPIDIVLLQLQSDMVVISRDGTLYIVIDVSIY